MVSIYHGVAWVLLLGAALGFAVLVRRIKRTEQFIGQYSLLVSWSLTSILIIGVTTLSILTLHDALPMLQVLVFILSAAAALAMPLAWLRFALQYTGQRFPTGRRTFIRIGLPVVLTFGVIVLTLGLGFLNFGLELQFLPEAALALMDLSMNYSIAMAAFYLGALLIAGASLVAWTTYSFNHLPNEGGNLLGIGAILPWAAIVIPEATDVFEGHPLLGIYHVTFGAVIGMGAVVVAVERFDLLSYVPAAGTVGRDVTVDQMDDPVVVTDSAGHVIDLNPAAEDAFQTTLGAIGRPIEPLVDGVELGDLTDHSASVDIQRGQRTFETTASELQDEYGQVLGYSFVFHDVTDRKRREQRIQVLNRVLRHNLRNDLNTVTGYAELAEEMDDPGEYLLRIQNTASKLISIGEKAREIEEIVANERRSRSANLPAVVTQAVAEVQEEADNCSLEVHEPVVDTAVNGPVLTSVLVELLENGCQHNDAEDPVVEIETALSEDDRPLRITITDNGPGIPDHELVPLQEGTETALEHGSGLGLWLVNWGVGSLNGVIDFKQDQPRGTVATIHLPASG